MSSAIKRSSRAWRRSMTSWARRPTTSRSAIGSRKSSISRTPAATATSSICGTPPRAAPAMRAITPTSSARKSIVRNLIHACNDLSQQAFEQALPANELLDAAERRILEIAEMGITGDTMTLHDAIQEAYDRLDQRKQRGDTGIQRHPDGLRRSRQPDRRIAKLRADHRRRPPAASAKRPSRSTSSATSSSRNGCRSCSSAWSRRASSWPSACCAARRGWTAIGCARASQRRRDREADRGGRHP